MAYTWRSDGSSYPPGRIDYILFSDSVMHTEKSFTIQTEVMPTDRLQLYGFSQYETSSASDHFPVIADFSINAAVGVSEVNSNKSRIYPNPAKEKIYISFASLGSYTISLFDSYGVLVFREENVFKEKEVTTNSISSGIYFISIIDANGNMEWHKIIKD